MSTITDSHSLVEIDTELNELIETIEFQIDEQGKPSDDVAARFHEFCRAHGEKVDRIGRFIRTMESRETHCRSEAARLSDRARVTANKISRTKSMVLFHLMSRDMRRVEGFEFTLSIRKNSVDSVKILDDQAVPMAFRTVEARIGGSLWEQLLATLPEALANALKNSARELGIDTEAIKAAAARHEQIPGAEVRRGSHLRVA